LNCSRSVIFLCERRHPHPAGAPTNVPSGLRRSANLV
jgi:hypothetical protein